jgi:hypothetical protein
MLTLKQSDAYNVLLNIYLPNFQTTVPHKEKHGVAAVIDKIVHPSHHADHKHADEHPVHSHPDVPSVPVAVPRDISDGGAPLAPGGSSVGGIL